MMYHKQDGVYSTPFSVFPRSPPFTPDVEPGLQMTTVPATVGTSLGCQDHYTNELFTTHKEYCKVYSM